MSDKAAFPAVRRDRQPKPESTVLKMAAVLYLRVSTDDQLDNFSIATQEHSCREFCRREGFTVSEVFQEAKSAKTAERPRFQAMIAHCQKHRKELAAVIVYAVSRFARSTRDHQNVRKQLEDCDIRLLSVTEGFDSRTPEGRFQENLMSSFAQFDNEQRSRRTVAGMKTAVESAGKWCHKPPVGLVTNADVPGGLAHDAERAPLIRTAFELFASGKPTKADVLRQVTALGLTNPQTLRPLTPQTFDKVLRNPIYAGWINLPSWNIRVPGRF